MKVFLLSTAGHTNKGDHLMVEGVIDFIRENYNDAKISVPFYSKFPAKNYKLYRVLSGHKYKNTLKHKLLNLFCIILNLFFNVVPKNVRYKLGFVCLNEVTCVFDTSGFYLGDQWPAENLYGMISCYMKYKKNGAKIVLLPKAFGPFTKHTVINLAKDLYNLSDVIFVRDSYSYKEYSNIIFNNDKLIQIPDYSGIVLPKRIIDQSLFSDKVCIIPNFRYFEKNKLEYKSYINFILETIKYLRTKDIESFFVIHSTIMDVHIAKQVNNLLEKKIDIIIEEDPKILKAYVGAACFTISSRYHGIINALSQGKPAIGTSWNHKYEELFLEYNIYNLLIINMDIEIMKRTIDYIIDKTNYNAIVTNIVQRNININEKIKYMYDYIKAIID